jgi:hypothetical protein
VTGEKRHWTDSKCECDIKNNYFPLEGENKCTGQSINCVWNQPCKKSLEGFDQIHIYSMSEGKMFKITFTLFEKSSTEVNCLKYMNC